MRLWLTLLSAAAAAVTAAAEAPTAAEEVPDLADALPADAEEALTDAVEQAGALVDAAAVDAAVEAVQGLAGDALPELDALSGDGGDAAALAAAAAAPAGGVWGASGTGAQSACDHPYMPLRQGATWTYDTGEGSYTWEVKSVEGNMDAATAVVLVTIEDIALEYTWDCAAGQGISSFDFAGQNMGAAFPEMTMDITAGEGAFLPPAEQMVPGHSWDASYEQTIEFNMGELGDALGDEAILVKADVTTAQTSTVLSADPITAAGITVEGVQVEQVSDILMVMDVMGTAVEQGQTLNSTFELGWGTGIMRQAVQSDFGPSSVELVSFYIP